MRFLIPILLFFLFLSPSSAFSADVGSYYILFGTKVYGSPGDYPDRERSSLKYFVNGSGHPGISNNGPFVTGDTLYNYSSSTFLCTADEGWKNVTNSGGGISYVTSTSVSGSLPSDAVLHNASYSSSYYSVSDISEPCGNPCAEEEQELINTCGGAEGQAWDWIDKDICTGVCYPPCTAGKNISGNYSFPIDSYTSAPSTFCVDHCQSKRNGVALMTDYGDGLMYEVYDVSGSSLTQTGEFCSDSDSSPASSSPVSDKEFVKKDTPALSPDDIQSMNDAIDAIPDPEPGSSQEEYNQSIKDSLDNILESGNNSNTGSENIQKYLENIDSNIASSGGTLNDILDVVVSGSSSGSGTSDIVNAVGEGTGSVVDAIGEGSGSIVDGINGLGEGINGLGEGINGLGDGLDDLGEGIEDLGSALDGVSEGSYSPDSLSDSPEPFEYDFGERFDSFVDDVKSTSLFSLPSSLGSSIPSGGDPVLSVDGGETYGEQSFDFSNFSTSLSILKSFLLICSGLVAIRIITLKK